MKRKSLPESQRVFTFVSASELLSKPAAMAVPVKVPVPCQIASSTPTPAVAVSPQSADPGICEYAGDYVYPGASGRKCTGTFCPSRIYGAVAVYESCPTRIAKLKLRAKEQS